MQEQAKETLCHFKKFEYLDPSELISVQYWVEEICFSSILIPNSDPQQYDNLMVDLANEYTINNNNYPQTIQEAKQMLS